MIRNLLTHPGWIFFSINFGDVFNVQGTVKKKRLTLLGIRSQKIHNNQSTTELTTRDLSRKCRLYWEDWKMSRGCRQGSKLDLNCRKDTQSLHFIEQMSVCRFGLKDGGSNVCLVTQVGRTRTPWLFFIKPLQSIPSPSSSALICTS